MGLQNKDVRLRARRGGYAGGQRLASRVCKDAAPPARPHLCCQLAERAVPQRSVEVPGRGFQVATLNGGAPGNDMTRHAGRCCQLVGQDGLRLGVAPLLHQQHRQQQRWLLVSRLLQQHLPQLRLCLARPARLAGQHLRVQQPACGAGWEGLQRTAGQSPRGLRSQGTGKE